MNNETNGSSMLQRVRTALTMVIATLCLSLSALAQDFGQDVEKLRAVYENSESLSLEIDIKVYNTQVGNVQLSASTVSLKKDHKKYKYRVDDHTMLLNENCMLLINHNEHKMVYCKRDKEQLELEEQALAEQIQPDLDEMLSGYESIKFNGVVNSRKHYTLTTKGKDAHIQKMEVYINAKSHLLEEIVYFYNLELFPENNKVIVKYHHIDTSPKFSSSEFSERSYVQRQGQTLRPHKKYQGYTVVVTE